VRAEVESVALGHLARDRAEVGDCEDERKAVIGSVETDAQRVAIDDLESRDRDVVVEAPRLLGGANRLVAAGELAFEQPQPRALDGGVEHAPVGVRVVRGGEFARLAAKRRIGREEDALLHPADPGSAAVGGRGHRLERARRRQDRSDSGPTPL